MVNNPVDEAAGRRVAAALSRQLALLDVGEAAVARVQRRPGRPKGAKSRVVGLASDEIIRRFGDARLHQMAVATMPLRELVALGLDVKDAIEAQRLAFSAVAPFVFKRMPVEVSVEGRQVVHLTVSMGDAGVVPTLDGAAVEIVGIQEVSGEATNDV